MSEVYSIILAIIAAGTAGLIGTFTLMKRLALAGDVLSHVALPGLGLAILFGISPLLGGTATLFLGIILISQLEKKSGLTTEVVIGVIFAASVALGALITPEEELIEALFGGFESISFPEFTAGVAIGLLTIFALWKLKDKLILNLFSQDLATATGVKAERLNLYFLLIFGLVIMLGLRFLGALLMGALIIIPAAAARQFTHTFSAFLATSSAISILSTVLGLAIASRYHLTLGPTIVLIAAGFFGVSLFKSKR